jgi:hypothetical protein
MVDHRWGFIKWFHTAVLQYPRSSLWSHLQRVYLRGNSVSSLLLYIGSHRTDGFTRSCTWLLGFFDALFLSEQAISGL